MLLPTDCVSIWKAANVLHFIQKVQKGLRSLWQANWPWQSQVPRQSAGARRHGLQRAVGEKHRTGIAVLRGNYSKEYPFQRTLTWLAQASTMGSGERARVASRQGSGQWASPVWDFDLFRHVPTISGFWMFLAVKHRVLEPWEVTTRMAGGLVGEARWEVLQTPGETLRDGTWRDISLDCYDFNYLASWYAWLARFCWLCQTM